MNTQASVVTELVMPTLTEPLLDTRTAIAVGDEVGDWLCAWCLNRVAIQTDRFQFEGRDQFLFSNPDGIPFRIMTFARTLGCSQAGVPTLEHTWFAGHAWSICQCDGCGEHLGWYYSGEHQFAGLIIERLVRGQCVRN